MLRLVLSLVPLSVLAAPPQAPRPSEPPASLRDAADRIASESARTNAAYQNLATLTDRIGARLSGSPQLDQAIAWATAQMTADGLQNVHAEPVMVPHWVRGEERAWLEGPIRKHLNVLGLGMSVGTPEGGITADVVVVGSYDELDKLGSAGVKGKIVCFDVPFDTYFKTVTYRTDGPVRAAKLGAVAALVRSIASASLDSPHTGTTRDDDHTTQIPAAAISIEGATLLHRLQERGERPRVHLEMGAHRLPDAPSANVVGELRGGEHPEEIVLLGAHLDSWDVGQGAQDDGTGCVIVMEAAHLLQSLGLRPKRTIRVVLFTNEENGKRGALRYAEAHAAEIPQIVAAFESDSGNDPATGFTLDFVGEGKNKAKGPARPLTPAQIQARATLRSLSPLFGRVGATSMEGDGSGTDVSPLVAKGVPGLGLDNTGAHYWEIHHSNADTFDKVNRRDLANNVAAVAIMAYALAELPDRLMPRSGEQVSR